ncbi:hypothetical protein PR202_ga14072 [Eleusine coracana subsp. coracana]|uniref:DUF3615 domain-containing protein n=1 Tax=Eleusine coracana subsp. coracana TaxID=191504 RepID=A0AAV5CGG4_ELECO|nr:hypothetical protein PR202_ga14072 [Eleusine coracana subsp. coracana]
MDSATIVARVTKETMQLNLTHILRSGRKVLVADTSKPAPLQYKKGCNMRLMMWLSAIPYREEPVYDVLWQTPVCAKVALEHYNRLNEEDEHELVKAVDSISFFFNGRWMHANFLAKFKGAKSCVDLVPKYFFAELKVGPDGKESCVSCIKMDPVGAFPAQGEPARAVPLARDGRAAAALPLESVSGGSSATQGGQQRRCGTGSTGRRSAMAVAHREGVGSVRWHNSTFGDGLRAAQRTKPSSACSQSFTTSCRRPASSL